MIVNKVFIDDFHLFQKKQKNQFIFQTYSLDDVDWLAERAPDTKSILTLYKLGLKGLDFSQLQGRGDKLAGITMPVSWTNDPKLLQVITAIGPPVYIHGKPSGINSRELHLRLAAHGVAGFYLD